MASNSAAIFKLENEISEAEMIRKGVRHYRIASYHYYCSISTLKLFLGVVINNRVDDNVLLADNVEDIQFMMDHIV